MYAHLVVGFVNVKTMFVSKYIKYSAKMKLEKL